MESCYPLAFGVPASIMILALIVFMSGKALYKINQPEGNMLVKVSKCITVSQLNYMLISSQILVETITKTNERNYNLYFLITACHA